MGVVWKCALYLKENFLIILNLVLGEGIRLESWNFSYRSLLVSEVNIWRLFCKRVLYLYKKYYMILNLVLGEGIRLEYFYTKYYMTQNWVLDERIKLESRNLLFRSLFVSVVKIWKWVWICVLYLYKILYDTKFGIGWRN